MFAVVDLQLRGFFSTIFCPSRVEGHVFKRCYAHHFFFPFTTAIFSEAMLLIVFFHVKLAYITFSLS